MIYLFRIFSPFFTFILFMTTEKKDSVELLNVVEDSFEWFELTGSVWKPEPGEVVEGLLLDKVRVLEYWCYRLARKEDSILVPCYKVLSSLDNLMGKPGAYVRIQYEGKEESPLKGGKPYHRLRSWLRVVRKSVSENNPVLEEGFSGAEILEDIADSDYSG